MKNKSPFLALSILPILLSCSSATKRSPQSDPSFHTTLMTYKTQVPTIQDVRLRVGIFHEPQDVTLKGCVIYLEGLADSIQNHRPLFKTLSQNGYRVLAFDYMGQGGSEGSMNHTRVYDPLLPGLEIGSQAKYIWQQFSHIKGPGGADCSKSKKMVIGWSTGGLASYKLAYEEWADKVVLIAPGIHPKTFVGEAANSPSLLLTGNQVITERTLTRNQFSSHENPHLDPIKPISPMDVKLFATNLLLTSEISQHWTIPQKVKGLVFLSGEEDTYVKLKETKETLSKKASHFTIVTYPGALHELDNEIPEVASDLQIKIIQFLDR